MSIKSLQGFRIARKILLNVLLLQPLSPTARTPTNKNLVGYFLDHPVLCRIYVHLLLTSADVANVRCREVLRIVRLAEITQASSRRENKSTSVP